jgi:hypothetical protein
MFKKINKNDKNFNFQNPLTCMYLMQSTFMKNLNFDIFCKERLFQIKTAITFAYGLEKNCLIYEKLSTKKFTSDFNRRRPFAQILASQNSKGKYESRKILDFARKSEKIDFFFKILNSKCIYYFRI